MTSPCNFAIIGITLFSLTSPGFGSNDAQEVVLCGVRGGLTGGASGAFLVLADNKIELLEYSGSSYREPFSASGFEREGAEDLGAIWTVSRENARVGESGHLVSAVYTGRFDRDIRAASEVVQNFLSLLRARKTPDAYGLVDKHFNRKIHSTELSKIAAFHEVDTTSGFSKTVCFAVENHSPGRIGIAVDAQCLGLDRPFVFVVSRIGTHWKIDGMRAVMNPQTMALF